MAVLRKPALAGRRPSRTFTVKRGHRIRPKNNRSISQYRWLCFGSGRNRAPTSRGWVIIEGGSSCRRRPKMEALSLGRSRASRDADVSIVSTGILACAPQHNDGQGVTSLSPRLVESSPTASTSASRRRRPRRVTSCGGRSRRLGVTIGVVGARRFRLAAALGLVLLVLVTIAPSSSTATAFQHPRNGSLRLRRFSASGRQERGRLVPRQQRLVMAARDGKGGKGDEDGEEGDKEKGGFLGGFFGGNKQKDGDDEKSSASKKAGGFFGGNKDGKDKSSAKKAAKKAAAKKAKGGEDEGEGPLKSLSKRIFQRRSTDEAEEDGEKGKKRGGGKDKDGEGVVVDASTFVGPTFPAPKNVSDLKAKREEELRRKEEDRIRAQAEAARKAKEAAEERERQLEEKLREVQRERDRKEMQKVIMKASQTNKKKDGGETAGTPSPAVPKESAKEEAGGPGVIKSAAGFVSGVWESVFSKKDKNEEWIVVCPKTRIGPGEIVPVTVAGLSLLVVVSRDGKLIHAISNSCPHLGTPLDTGLVERRLKPGVKVPPGKDVSAMGNDCFEECVVCPLHNTAFELNSGEVRGEWCPYPPVIGKVMGTVKPKTNLPKFDIRTRGKNVEIKINTSLE